MNCNLSRIVHSCMNSFVIGISGGSASGKTTLACLISKVLGKDQTNLISLDNYYLDFVSQGFNPDAINYDTPQSIDVALLVHDLKLLLDGQPVEMPLYDFGTHTRKKSGLIFSQRHYILIEGLFLFNIKLLAPFFKLRIYVDTPDTVRLQRRIERDTRERHRSIHSVMAQYDTFVYPGHIRYVQPNRKLADLIIRGDRPFQDRMHEIIHLIDNRKTK